MSKLRESRTEKPATAGTGDLDQVDRSAKSLIVGASAGATLAAALVGSVALAPLAIPVAGAVVGALINFYVRRYLDTSRRSDVALGKERIGR